MLEWFKCLDGEIIPVKDCLTKCRLDGRCMTLPLLTRISREREWNGVASTTQLINGTMYSFLKLTRPYVVDPDKMIFAIHGEKVHKVLEDVAKDLGLPAEVALTTEDRDIFDLLEPNGDGTWTLTDNKVWGSFRVAKSLGMIETGKKPDPTGAVYQKSGKWGATGTPKMVGVFQRMPQEADNWETELQLGRYSVKLGDRGVHVTKLQAEMIVRDGGLAVAYSRGLGRNSYLIPIKPLPRQHIIDYFERKDRDLHLALEQNKWDTPCNNQECWNGNRCKGYCEVAIYCPKGLIEQGGVR